MSDEPALFRAFPALRRHVAYAPCTRLPTRVHRLVELARAFGVAELWVKRDDESSPAYGGNKPRKLDFLLGEALARRARSVITFGGIGTNHGIATAVFARQFGLRCILGLIPQPVTEKVRHCLLVAQGLGAELHYGPTIPRLVPTMLRVYLRELFRLQRPYVIAPGGSSVTGALGFVSAALELKEQIDAGALPAPDWIFVPVGSGGTLAGLVLGCKLAGLPSRVAGVLATDLVPPNAGRVARLANRTHARLRRIAPGLPYVHVSAAEIMLEKGFVGRGYGMPTEAARKSRDALEQLEGMAAETTYTGKCLAALHALSEAAPFRGARLLYWHTYNYAPTEGVPPPYRNLPLEFHDFFHGPPVAD